MIHTIVNVKKNKMVGVHMHGMQTHAHMHTCRGHSSIYMYIYILRGQSGRGFPEEFRGQVILHRTLAEVNRGALKLTEELSGS